MAPPSASQLLQRARTAQRESKYVDFKEQFDPDSHAEWCELVKDVVAMTNSGQGIVIFGVRNNGALSGANVQDVLNIDPATVTDKVFRYTGEHFAGFEIHELRRHGGRIAAIRVELSPRPLVFVRPGTYAVADGKQKTAFSQGTVYVRHGAKSEPATSADLAAIIDRQIEVVRRSWLGKIRKVVAAPPGAEIAVFERTASDKTGRPMTIRVTDDPDAPLFGKVDPYQTHPHRQKELLHEVNGRLPGKTSINSYDVLCVRSVHHIDDQRHPVFCYLPKFGSMQYSDAFVAWLVKQFKTDRSFFSKARARYYERRNT